MTVGLEGTCSQDLFQKGEGTTLVWLVLRYTCLHKHFLICNGERTEAADIEPYETCPDQVLQKQHFSQKL